MLNFPHEIPADLYDETHRDHFPFLLQLHLPIITASSVHPVLIQWLFLDAEHQALLFYRGDYLIVKPHSLQFILQVFQKSFRFKKACLFFPYKVTLNTWMQ